MNNLTPKQRALAGHDQIEPMLAASTAHVDPAEADMLDGNRHSIPVTMQREEGWLIYIANSAEELADRLREGKRPASDTLRQLIERAHALGCCWLLLDRDAAPVADIDTHEW